MRSPCCDDDNLKKGPWTPEEDQKLVDYINKHGYGSWRALPKLAGLNRCGKSCRLRWTNYLRPDIKRGKFSEDEERLIIHLHSVLGNKWSRIASHLPGRTDNEIKNFWNTHIRKKLLSMGIDPTTHKPTTDINHFLSLSQLLQAARVGNFMNPWENNALRLQADAAQLAKIQLIQNLLQLINTTTIPNINQNVLLGHQNPDPFEGLLNGTTSSMYTKEPDLLPNASLINSGLNIPKATNDQQAPTNSWSSFESGYLNLEGPDILNNDSLSNPSAIQPESTLPQLVSASPEPTTTNQMERNGNTTQLSTTSSPVSKDFEAWEKVLLEDDENIGSYWQNILDFSSSAPSPISW